jgi:head-tail adaptor
MTTTPRHLLDQTVSIQRRTISRDANGAPVETWAAHLSSIPARVQPQAGSESNLYGAERARRPVTVFVAGGQDILERDRVLWGTRYLDILSVKDPQSLGAILRLDCEEVT